MDNRGFEHLYKINKHFFKLNFLHQTSSESELCETDQSVLSPSSERTTERITSKSDDTSCFTEPWVNRKNDFTSDDKTGSERSGRYFNADWFVAFENGLHTTERERSTLFGLHISQPISEREL